MKNPPIIPTVIEMSFMALRRSGVRIVLPLLLLVPFADAQSRNEPPNVVYEESSNQWFEAAETRAAISSDGKWALFTTFGTAVRLVSLETGHENASALSTHLDSIPETAVFCGNDIARLGKGGSVRGWFLSNGTQLPSVPADALPQCSSDGGKIAYFFAQQSDAGVFVGSNGTYEHYKIKGKITGVAFAPDGSLYALSFGVDGNSSLARIYPHKPGFEILASNLDADPFSSNIAVAPDGNSLFVSLATDSAPDNSVRSQPQAERWLKIFRLDLSSGARHVIAQSADEDNFDPSFADGYLYWNRNKLHSAIAVVPTEGGGAREIVQGGALPIWSFDGRRISYYIGGWRLADWAINWDAAVTDVNAKAERVSEPRIIVSGFHEDFPAAFSPNGRWIAFHSHRSSTPVAEYSSPGSTDDIYLRRTDDNHAPEIRLTDYGWEAGSAFWSPDGRRLIFSSWVKGGQPGISRLWVITLDPDTGKPLRTEELRLPEGIHSAQWASWSPNGSEIAIEDDREGEERSLWVVHADGTQGQKVLDYRGSTYGGLDWTPDGKSIIYSGLDNSRMQLFAVSRQGGQPHRLTNDSGNLIHPRVSPDGKWIACTRLVQSKQIWRTRLRSESK